MLELSRSPVLYSPRAVWPMQASAGQQLLALHLGSPRQRRKQVMKSDGHLM